LIINESKNNKSTYNFDVDLQDHKTKVSRYLSKLSTVLLDRGYRHDDSKLTSPEYDMYRDITSELQQYEYNSPEYKNISNSRAFKDAWMHHAQENSHHPDHYPNGVSDMDLVDIMEMLCDWYSASQRHENASWRDGFNSNCEQFNIDDQLKSILWNTFNRYLSNK
jgi:hypothetical protein